jgi:hypothetical protein
MALKVFDAKSLAEIDDGRIGAALQAELDKAREDCRDRPVLKKGRKVKLELTLTPVADDHGDLDGIKVTFKVASAMPARERQDFSVGVKHDGRMFYSEHSTDNVNQRTLDAMDE